VSNNTELFKCLAENGMSENGYSCGFLWRTEENNENSQSMSMFLNRQCNPTPPK
jgi:hypothetical protein